MAFNPFASVQNWYHFNIEGLFDLRDMTRRFKKGIPATAKQLDTLVGKGEKALVTKGIPALTKASVEYPALAAAGLTAAALFTPQGRAISSGIAGGIAGTLPKAGYAGMQSIVGGNNGNESTVTQADPGRVRRKSAAKPGKKRKAVKHTRRSSAPVKRKAVKRKAVKRKAVKRKAQRSPGRR